MRRRATLLLAMSVFMASGRARAQVADAQQPLAPPSSTETGRAELPPEAEKPAAETPATETPAAPPPADPYAEAKKRVARGEALFEQGNFDAALAELSRAYETMAGHPARYVVLFNIAQCYEKLYRYDGAIDAYRRYLAEGGSAAEDAPTVKAKVEVLLGLLGKVRLRVRASSGALPPKYEVWVDGRHVGDNLTTFSLPGGNHEVELRARGFAVEKRVLGLPATTTRSLELVLEPLAAEYRGLRPTMFWVASGLAGAALATGGVVGGMALSARAKVDEQLAAGPPESLGVSATDQRRIRNLATTADVCFLASGVFASSAVVLAFLTDFGKPRPVERPPARASAARAGVRLTPGLGSISLRGAF